jgi:hypothetical protein
VAANFRGFSHRLWVRNESCCDTLTTRFKDWTCVDESQPTINGKKCYGRAHVLTFTARPKPLDELKRSFETSAATARTD